MRRRRFVARLAVCASRSVESQLHTPGSKPLVVSRQRWTTAGGLRHHAAADKREFVETLVVRARASRVRH